MLETTSSRPAISAMAPRHNSSNSSSLIPFRLNLLTCSLSSDTVNSGEDGTSPPVLLPSSFSGSPHSHFALRSLNSSMALSATTLTLRTFSPSLELPYLECCLSERWMLPRFRSRSTTRDEECGTVADRMVYMHLDQVIFEGPPTSLCPKCTSDSRTFRQPQPKR